MIYFIQHHTGVFLMMFVFLSSGTQFAMIYDLKRRERLHLPMSDHGRRGLSFGASTWPLSTVS